MKKRLIYVLFCGLITTGMVGCGSGNNSGSDTDSDSYNEYVVKASKDSLVQYTSGMTVNNDSEASDAGTAVVEDTDADDIEGRGMRFDYEDVTEQFSPEAIHIIDNVDGNIFSKSSEDAVNNMTVSISTVPEKYDSRDVSGKAYVTPARDQGYTYLCWSYAAIGAIEADLLKHHTDLSADTINLSEKHLAYYNMHKASGSKNGLIDEDYRELVNAMNEQNAWIFDYDTGYVSVGGVTDYVASVLTAWKGPVNESGSDAFTTLYGMEAVFTDNKDLPSSAYKADYHVQGVYEIPATKDNLDEVKQLIMEHGAVTCSVNSSSAYWNNSFKDMYDYNEYGEGNLADHEVLIVGWDDEYPASNFGVTPPGDGAFIARNSWGQMYGENGFCYISYYDNIVTNNNIAAYDVVTPSESDYYDNNYQVDGFITYTVSALEDKLNLVYAESDNSNPYGVLYNVEDGNETVRAVGIWSLETNTSYEIRIYKNPEVQNGKISFDSLGNPDAIQTAAAATGGFHTFALDTEVDVDVDDTFLCLVIPMQDGKLVYEKAMNKTGESNYDEWNHLTGNIHTQNTASGKSYYLNKDGDGLEVQTDRDFSVKVYTDNR